MPPITRREALALGWSAAAVPSLGLDRAERLQSIRRSAGVVIAP